MVNEWEERTEIAFFDVETTIPIRPGQGFAMLEFGSILVCPKKLVEIESYSTLICPNDLSLISSLSVRCNGITKDAVVSAPPFSLVADKLFDILHGRIWAGHNILRFDCARIREAFAAINRPAPEPRGTIDSLALLTQRFGRRAGDMKICLTERVYYFVGHVNSIESTHEMATLATYFGLGQQTHRSLDDVRMNLEVLKYCATVLFLESSLPDIFTEKSWVSPNATTRSRSNFKFSPESIALNSSTSTSKVNLQHPNLLPTNHSTEENHPILAFVTPNTEPITPQQDPFDMAPLNAEVDPLPSDDSMDEESGSGCPETSTAAKPEGPSGCGDFLEPEEVSISSISVSLAPFYRGLRRIQILHNDNVLQLCCIKLKVRFNVSMKFADNAGRPRLNFVVDAIPSVCAVLDKCDSLAQRLSVESGSSSEWRPVVTRKAGYFNSPTIRLHIPTVADGNMMRWVTEIYAKEASSTTPQTLVFSRYEVAELEALFMPGTFVDAYVSLDPYDYQQNAGIRLVAKKLIVHSN